MRFFIDEPHLHQLRKLPWGKPLEKWNDYGVKFIPFRSGQSRHIVRFLKAGQFSYAIKETTKYNANLEYENYIKLIAKGIHTLTPVGTVLVEREKLLVKTKAGAFPEENISGYIITMLDTSALPDSYLLRLNFKLENKKVILKAIAELFAVIHYNNIYWGDASLANLMIRFVKGKDDFGRVRTELKAVLADAETVRFLPEISLSLRRNELKYFYESMLWLGRDFSVESGNRTPPRYRNDYAFLKKSYNYYYKFFIMRREFNSKTGLDLDFHLRGIKDHSTIKALMNQIEEHKWYLSERVKGSVSTAEAAKSWYEEIYNPTLNEFSKLGIYKYFPFRTPAVLYLEIMTHKYYLSEAEGKDVGLRRAISDYAARFGDDPNFLKFVKRIISAVLRFVKK